MNLRKAIQFSNNSKIHEPILETVRLNHHSGGEAAKFNLIVSGISLRKTPDTIFNVIDSDKNIVSTYDLS